MKHPISLYRSLWMSFAAALAVAGAAQAVQKKDKAVRMAGNFIRTTGPTPAPPSRPVDPAAQEYVIGREDVLAIDVWREPEISRVEPVRPDGRITLPLVGEVLASGETPSALEQEIGAKLSGYIHDPAVTVIVQQANSHHFNIIGDVLRPGSYALDGPITVLDAIAVAGGFREFAKLTRIYVVRRLADGNSIRIRFNYKAAVGGSERELNLTLKPGDTVIVP
ncbi:MAG: polysaccharide biosynthesis/export family protein [Acidobacteriota bacterium]|nr:polysaccharide biosynthesis/export family protein [Acidobacteriota bacterium]